MPPEISYVRSFSKGQQEGSVLLAAFGCQGALLTHVLAKRSLVFRQLRLPLLAQLPNSET